MDEKLLARALGAALARALGAAGGLGSTAAGKAAGDGVDEAVDDTLDQADDGAEEVRDNTDHGGVLSEGFKDRRMISILKVIIRVPHGVCNGRTQVLPDR